MTFNSVKRNGKNPREKRSINIAFRNRCCAGVKVGNGSVAFGTELVRGVNGVIEPLVMRTDWRCIHGLFESTLSVRSRKL